MVGLRATPADYQSNPNTDNVMTGVPCGGKNMTVKDCGRYHSVRYQQKEGF